MLLDETSAPTERSTRDLESNDSPTERRIEPIYRRKQKSFGTQPKADVEEAISKSTERNFNFIAEDKEKSKRTSKTPRTASEKKESLAQDSSRPQPNPCSPEKRKSSSHRFNESDCDVIMKDFRSIYIRNVETEYQGTECVGDKRGNGQNNESEYLELNSRGPTKGPSIQVGCVEHRNDEWNTVMQNAESKYKPEEGINYQSAQPIEYRNGISYQPLSSYPADPHQWTNAHVDGFALTHEDQVTICNDSTIIDWEFLSEEPFEEVTIDDLMSTLNETNTDWSGAIDNVSASAVFELNGMTQKETSDIPIDIDIPVSSIPVIDDTFSDETRILPRLPGAESVTSSRNASTTDQVPVEPTSPQSLQKMKAFRYVAGLSTEDILRADEEGDTILHLAILKEELHLVDALILRFNRDRIMSHVINLRNSSNQTPLCMAVYSNLPSVIAKLIGLGADVNVQVQVMAQSGTRCRHYRVLHYAVIWGEEWKRTVLELLQAKTIDVDAFNSEGRSPLHLAIEAHGRQNSRKQLIDSRNIIQDLANHGANLNIQDKQSGRTPLHYILEKKDSKFLAWFLTLVSSCSRGSLRYQPSSGDSGSVRFGGSNNDNILQQVLNARTLSGTSSLEIAQAMTLEQEEKAKIIELLIRNGVQVPNVGKNSNSSKRKSAKKMT